MVSRALVLFIVLILQLSAVTFVLTRPVQAPGELASELEDLSYSTIERPISLEVAFPNLTLEQMSYLTTAGDGRHRIFVSTIPGVIHVFPNEQTVDSTTIFLDITGKVHTGFEQGLIGLAFDPKFGSNGYFYIYYTSEDLPRRSVISRFTADSIDHNTADPDSELMILEVEQPFPRHNGGQLAFGTDGYLYVGLGDGGESFDQLFPKGWLSVGGEAQDRSSLLGSILRIDVSASSLEERYQIPLDNPFVNVEGIRGEIWAYGLRNPWRFSFAPGTMQLWVADVGQGEFEEVNIIERGGNYGWNILEGRSCYPPSITLCQRSGTRAPMFAYAHDPRSANAVIGGYVYVGDRIPDLRGAYIFGDFNGSLWAIRFENSQIIELLELVDSNMVISSFGIDATGELYVLDLGSEKIFMFAR